MSALKKNHFELLGLPVRFAIDRTLLDDAYRRVQSAVHPDRHAGQPEAQRRVAMQLATQVNEAYRTLRDPTRRAAYLCELHGADPEVHSNTAMPPDFLMQQMEWRERLQDACEQRDTAALDALRGELSASASELRVRLAEALDGEGDFARGAGLVRRMMFIDRITTEIDLAEERILQA